MLELLTLSLKNFRSFKDESTVSLENRNKIIQIDGKNLNTGGSSGAGKTSLFLALDYLLGVSDIPSTVLQTRNTNEGIEVEGTFLLDNKPLKIKRSKKSGLSIDYNGEVTSGNAKVTEETLEAILGIPKKILRRMVHKHQNEGGFFLDMTAKETYEFLVEMLNLNNYINLSKKIDLDVKEIDSKLLTADNWIATINSKLQITQSLLSNLNPPTLDVENAESLLSSLREALETYKREATQIESAQSQELSALISPIVNQDESVLQKQQTCLSELVTLKQDVQLLEGQKQQTQQSVRALQQQQQQIEVLKVQAKNLAESVNALTTHKKHMTDNSTCPTCLQIWLGEGIENKIKSIEVEIAGHVKTLLSYKTQIDHLPNIVEQIVKYEKDFIDLESQIQVKKKSISSTEQAIASIKQEEHNRTLTVQLEHSKKVNEIKGKYEAALKQKQSEIHDTQMRLLDIEGKVKVYNMRLQDYEKEKATLEANLSEHTSALDAGLQNKQEIEHRLKVANETNRFIKQFVLQTFQDTLDLIGEVATNILRSIPNMQTSTVYFESSRETKSGTIKDEVNAILSKEGDVDVSIKSLSGGERTTVDLAVDLAVIDVIEAKTGRGANFYIVDEPFNGLDGICKENYLDILKQLDTNKKIIIVDHSTELKEMVYDKITVIKQGEYSIIESN